MNVDELAQYCDRVAMRFENDSLQRAMAACAEIAEQSTRDAFTSSADPITDSDWAPRVDPGDGHPLLIDTGALLQAATGGGAGHVRVVSPREMVSGVDKGAVVYAAVHNFGWPDRNIPQRRYLGFTRRSVRRCRDVVVEHARNFFLGRS
jgi:phage gpG-like protein